jgi:serine/threonine-protein kinase/endoribonuclease IRE1
MQDGVILIGRMRVGPAVLGYGSGGTVVFSGELDGRPVAVKRMLRQFYEMARKEIDALILADEHPNIVRWVHRLLASCSRYLHA